MNRRRKVMKTSHWSFNESKGRLPTRVEHQRNPGGPAPILHTFDDWAAAGFRIKKGEKSTERNDDGVPVFGLEQVWTKDKRARLPAFTTSAKQPPPAKKTVWEDWSQPSALVEEVKERVRQKELAEAQADHDHLDSEFQPQQFTDDDEPPW
jgi:hypothetical protein